MLRKPVDGLSVEYRDQHSEDAGQGAVRPSGEDLCHVERLAKDHLLGESGRVGTLFQPHRPAPVRAFRRFLVGVRAPDGTSQHRFNLADADAGGAETVFLRGFVADDASSFERKRGAQFGVVDGAINHAVQDRQVALRAAQVRIPRRSPTGRLTEPLGFYRPAMTVHTPRSRVHRPGVRIANIDGALNHVHAVAPYPHHVSDVCAVAGEGVEKSCGPKIQLSTVSPDRVGRRGERRVGPSSIGSRARSGQHAGDARAEGRPVPLIRSGRSPAFGPEEEGATRRSALRPGRLIRGVDRSFC